jgi:hypothetical protein
VADLHIPSLTLSAVEWRILILSCIKFSTGNYRENLQIVECNRSDCKITDILLDIVTCDGDNMKAKVSVCFVLQEIPIFFLIIFHTCTLVSVLDKVFRNSLN